MWPPVKMSLTPLLYRDPRSSRIHCLSLILAIYLNSFTETKWKLCCLLLTKQALRLAIRQEEAGWRRAAGSRSFQPVPLAAAAGGVSSPLGRPLLESTVNDFTGTLPVLNTCLPSTFFYFNKSHILSDTLKNNASSSSSLCESLALEKGYFFHTQTMLAIS